MIITTEEGFMYLEPHDAKNKLSKMPSFAKVTYYAQWSLIRFLVPKSIYGKLSRLCHFVFMNHESLTFIIIVVLQYASFVVLVISLC